MKKLLFIITISLITATSFAAKDEHADHDHASEHKSEHDHDHESEHKSEHDHDHESEHKSEHDHDHESEHKAEHDHDHESEQKSEHAGEEEAHDIGQVSVANVVYRVGLHGEITEGSEAVISIEAEQGQAPKEIRAWIGIKNGRGSVKSLLRAESNGHFHGHLEVPKKLAKGSAIWLGVRTEAGHERGSVAIPKDDHAH